VGAAVVSIDARLNRLLPALSGKERAKLVLCTYKEKKPQDYRMGQGMDPAEVREYNRLIKLMNACNMEVLIIVILLRERAAKIDLKLGWLATLEMWCEHAEMVELYLRGLTKEPITVTAYQEMLDAEPGRWAPVSELADVLTSRKRDWADAQVEDREKLVVSADEWERETKRNERLLTGLVKAKTLQGRRRGGELEVRVGSFYAWLGEEVTVRPEWGFDYDLAPDDEVGLVDQLKTARARIKESFTRKEFSPPGAEGRQSWSLYRMMAEGLRRRVKADLETTWAEVLALDTALAKVAEEFDGEDVLRPETRGDLDRTVEDLKEAHAQLQDLGVEFTLPALSQEEVEANLEFIHHFAER